MPVDAQGARALCNLLTAALRDPALVVELTSVELDLLLRVARRCRLLGRLASDLQSLALMQSFPPTAVDQLQSALIAADAQSRMARWELNRIAWALEGLEDVPVVALKGCAYVLAGLPNAVGRLFADIDLLVPEPDLHAVEERLLRRGWQAKELSPYDERYYREWAHELPPLVHSERGVELDLHHGILMRAARLRPASPLLFEPTRAMPGSRYKVLAPVDMVLHAMVHLFYGSEMDDALRELVDIDDLLRFFAANEPGFWEQFWSRTTALGLERPAFYALRYSTRLLGTPVPKALLASSLDGAPAAPLLRFMDWLVPRALFPQHPEASSRRTELARWLLYVRSHWVKMPPLMLARHLSHKLYVRLMPKQASSM
jgi:hypothetical protein